MEVFLKPAIILRGKISLLHACGGVSSGIAALLPVRAVFSTHVEVFLIISLLIVKLLGLLHACGGVSGRHCC